MCGYKFFIMHEILSWIHLLNFKYNQYTRILIKISVINKKYNSLSTTDSAWGIRDIKLS